MDFFARCEPIRAFRGDTLPEFRVDVSGMGDLANCTMKMVLEHRYDPGYAVFSKNCTKGDGDYYTVQLLTADTEALMGTYSMYFVLTDTDGNDHKNLYGIIEFLAFPEEAT